MKRFSLQLESLLPHAHVCRLCSEEWACRGPECEVNDEDPEPGKLRDAEYMDCPACSTGRHVACNKCKNQGLRRQLLRPQWAKCLACGHMQVLYGDALEDLHEHRCPECEQAWDCIKQCDMRLAENRDVLCDRCEEARG